ncbi:MAG TPA: VanZ family protein [Thiobacillus sp.]
MMPNPAGFHQSRRLLLGMAVLYASFVIYGSLVPLDYHALPWATAVARFADIPFLKLGIGSRADWVANLLLFIPLTFLWMGVFAAGRGRVSSGLIAVTLIPVATALSVGIEFTQLYFPPRTVSQNDILAETVGGIVGVLVWLTTGSRFVEWLQSWQQTHARAALAERMAWVYLAGVLVYNVLPLDLTISLVEIFHKWQSGNVNLIPFGRIPADPAYALYELATDALIWTPLALLWRLDGTRGAWRVWRMTLATAVVLECLQLFVYSRVSDVTDIFTAGAGAALGCVIGGRLAQHEASETRVLPWSVWFPWLAASGWMITLLFVFWFPFDFRTDGTFIKSRLDFVYRVPFEVYYFGTEYRAITEVLRKTLFFAPLGGVLAWGVARQPWRWRAPLFALSMLILVGLPALVELGQVMLPHKIADTTDWFLAWLGGLTGYGVSRYMLRAPRRIVPSVAATHAATVVTAPLKQSVAWHIGLSVFGFAALIWLAVHMPWMPYNVRELLRPDAIWLSAFLLAGMGYWLAVWPVWLARRHVSGIHRLWQLPAGLLVYGLFSFLLVRMAVPDESVYDLVGSPVLDWPRQWELGVRWLALLAVPGTLLYLAAQTVRQWRGRQLGVWAFLAAIPVLMLAYWGVVAQAGTDNLTELMASPRPLAFAALSAWLFSLFCAAAWIAAPASIAQRVLRSTSVVVSLLLAVALLSLGLANEIDKYGHQFSAMQFLLSSDRQHYASQTVIWLRYSVLHILVTVALSFLQWPYFRASPRLRAAAFHAIN